MPFESDDRVLNVWRGEMLLGEGPVWDDSTQKLWFVDIKKRKAHRLDPISGAVDSWSAPAQIGWVLPAADGTLIAGLQTGLSRFEPATGRFTHIVEVEPTMPGNRLNDATVAPDGCIWFGSMDDGHERPSGHVYRFDGARVLRTAIAPVPITNGPALSPDGRTLYHVDTTGGLIHAVSIEAGRTTRARKFVDIDPVHGSPDGVTVDAAGNVWVALWGGWCVRCYAPNGAMIEEVRFPVAHVTKIAFGGNDLRTVYATTARIGLDRQALARQPEAGSVFSFKVKVPGQALTLARVSD